MILKEYQRLALDRIQEFLVQMADMRDKMAKIFELGPELELEPEMVDWVRGAWKKIVPNRSY